MYKLCTEFQKLCKTTFICFQIASADQSSLDIILLTFDYQFFEEVSYLKN